MALIIANWKMHLTLQEAENICTRLMSIQSNNNFIITPCTPYLSYLANKFPLIDFASQDVSIYDGYGSYTGEYSASSLKSCNIKYVITGHAERRVLFHEQDDIIKKKISNIFAVDLVPIICIGESLLERKNNNHCEIIRMQLEKIEAANKECIIAYEPIWSIGTSKNPTDYELKEIFDIIKNYLIKAGIVNNVRLVYGGSVTPKNIKQILAIDNIDGVLVGVAALTYDNLKQII